MDCVFCKLVKGEIPSSNIYEDENNLAFLDVNPHAKGHTVVIPKEHRESFFDLGVEEVKGLWLAVKEVMGRLKEKLDPEGFNVGWNEGEEAGQVVPHLHVHIIPRYVGDGGGSMHSIIKNPGDMSAEEVGKLFTV